MNPHEWQPIDTAPKDGTHIVGWREDAGITMVCFGCLADFLSVPELERLDAASYETAWSDEDWFSLGVMGGYRLEGDEVPTYWMLPEKPTMQEAP